MARPTRTEFERTAEILREFNAAHGSDDIVSFENLVGHFSAEYEKRSNAFKPHLFNKAAGIKNKVAVQ
jgi:hypothetical protein